MLALLYILNYNYAPSSLSVHLLLLVVTDRVLPASAFIVVVLKSQIRKGIMSHQNQCASASVIWGNQFSHCLQVLCKTHLHALHPAAPGEPSGQAAWSGLASVFSSVCETALCLPTQRREGWGCQVSEQGTAQLRKASLLCTFDFRSLIHGTDRAAPGFCSLLLLVPPVLPGYHLHLAGGPGGKMLPCVTSRFERAPQLQDSVNGSPSWGILHVRRLSLGDSLLKQNQTHKKPTMKYLQLHVSHRLLFLLLCLPTWKGVSNHPLKCCLPDLVTATRPPGIKTSEAVRKVERDKAEQSHSLQPHEEEAASLFLASVWFQDQTGEQAGGKGREGRSRNSVLTRGKYDCYGW